MVWLRGPSLTHTACRDVPEKGFLPSQEPATKASSSASTQELGEDRNLGLISNSEMNLTRKFQRSFFFVSVDSVSQSGKK